MHLFYCFIVVIVAFILPIKCGKEAIQEDERSPEKKPSVLDEEDTMFIPDKSAKEQRSQWVDPYDMFGESGKNIRDPGVEYKDQSQTEGADNKEPDEELVRVSLKSAASKEGQEDISLFKKFVQKVLVCMRKNRNVFLAVPPPMESKWREFMKSSNGANIDVVFDTLVESIVEAPMPTTFVDTIRAWMPSNAEVLSMMIPLGIFISFVMILQRIRFMVSPIGALLLVLFLVSIPWEWYRMYRVALSEKMATLDVKDAEECFSESSSIWRSASSWISSKVSFKDDACLKYHQQLLVDPILKVSPIKAFSVTVTSVLIEPLSYIADAFGKSFAAFFAHIPLIWQPFAMLALGVILVTLLVFIVGLRISTLFGSLQVGGRLPSISGAVEDIDRRAVQSTRDNSTSSIDRSQATIPRESISAPQIESIAAVASQCDQVDFDNIAESLLEYLSQKDDVSLNKLDMLIGKLKDISCRKHLAIKIKNKHDERLPDNVICTSSSEDSDGYVSIRGKQKTDSLC